MMVIFEDLAPKPHKPKIFLYSQTKCLRSKYMQEFKIKWMVGSIKDATEEWKYALKTNFFDFSLQEYNLLERIRVLRAYS